MNWTDFENGFDVLFDVPPPLGNRKENVMGWIEISKAKDWPGLGRGFNVRLQGMEAGTTIYAQTDVELEEKIERVKREFQSPDLVMMPERY